ncbi:hypothetical protein BH11MYX2_BH11MYX2_06850 [soil metagenome]
MHLLLVPFALLALVAAFAPLNRIDVALSLAAQRATVFDTLLRAVSFLGNRPQSIVLVLVVMAMVFAVGWRRDALFIGGSASGAWLIYQAVQFLDPRTRPRPPIHLAESFNGPSFPSGHLMNYMALFAFLIIVVRHRMAPSLARPAIVAALAAQLILVGPSRVYLGAHFTSDVLGGYLLGGWWVLVVGHFYARPTVLSA